MGHSKDPKCTSAGIGLVNPGEGIGNDVVLPSLILNGIILPNEFRKVNMLLRGLNGLATMISKNCKRVPQQELPPTFNCGCDGMKLTDVCGGGKQFRAELLTEIGNEVLVFH